MNILRNFFQSRYMPRCILKEKIQIEKDRYPIFCGQNCKTTISAVFLWILQSISRFFTFSLVIFAKKCYNRITKRGNCAKGDHAVKGRRFWKGLLLSGLLCSLSLTVAAGTPLTNQRFDGGWSRDGLVGADTSGYIQSRPQKMHVIEADPKKYELMIGGSVNASEMVRDMTPITDRDVQTVAAVNGDHFSFQTGIPLGMSISDGEIVTSPVPAYNADEYYFHALGITADGTVLTGENPTLYMQYTVGEHTGSIERINRTREIWEGAQICLFTPRYGDSTDTNPAGVEFIIRVDEGAVRAGSTMTGTIVGVDEDGDAPIEDGHVVLSISLLRYDEVEALALGDEVEFYFSFEQEEWNDVTFAVGGNRTAVENGEAKPFQYTVGAFTTAAPRTALGVKADGTIVLAAVDGRSDEANGMTANEMADYLASELECEHAILLDGGGSTAMAVWEEDGTVLTVNVPSEPRAVGNGVMLVKKDGIALDTMWIVCGAAVAVIVAVGAVVIALVLRTPKK